MAEDEIWARHKKYEEEMLTLFTAKREEFHYILDKISGHLYEPKPTDREFEWWYDKMVHVGYYILFNEEVDHWLEAHRKHNIWLENHAATFMYRCGGDPAWKKEFYDAWSTEWCPGLIEQSC